MITSLSITVNQFGSQPVTMGTLRAEDVDYLFDFLGGLDYVIDTALSKAVESTTIQPSLSILSELYSALSFTTRNLTRVDNPVRAAINATTVTLFCQTFVSQLAAGQNVDITTHTD